MWLESIPLKALSRRLHVCWLNGAFAISRPLSLTVLGHHTRSVAARPQSIQRKELDSEGLSAKAVLFRLHAARALLFLEAGDRLAACDIRRSYRSVLHVHSACAGIFCPKAPRPALPLDVLYVRSVYSRLRRHARHGDLDLVARDLPAGRSYQSDYGGNLH